MYRLAVIQLAMQRPLSGCKSVAKENTKLAHRGKPSRVLAFQYEVRTDIKTEDGGFTAASYFICRSSPPDVAPQTLIEQVPEVATIVQVCPATRDSPNLESAAREFAASVQSPPSGLPAEVVQSTGPAIQTS